MPPSKDIPIIINSFNRVTSLKKMVEDLRERGYYNFHILDNNSTYPPLITWYSTQAHLLNIHYMGNNYMQNALFDYKSGEFLQSFKGKWPWIVYSDPDLEFNEKMPDDVVEQLIAIAEKYNYHKAGLALRIDDLPLSQWGEANKLWEEKYWMYPIEKDIYKAQIDTTFCVIKPSNGLIFDAVRVAGDFTCRHLPWYVDFENLDDEERNFLETSHPYSTYKRYYDSVKH